MKIEQETQRTVLCVVPGCSFRPARATTQEEAEKMAAEHLESDPTHYMQVNSITFLRKVDDPPTAA